MAVRKCRFQLGAVSALYQQSPVREYACLYMCRCHCLNFQHQDPFAPPSRCHAVVPAATAGFPQEYFATRVRRVALCDFLSRRFHECAAAAGADQRTESGEHPSSSEPCTAPFAHEHAYCFFKVGGLDLKAASCWWTFLDSTF